MYYQLNTAEFGGVFAPNLGRGRKSGGACATAATPSLAPLNIALCYVDFKMVKKCFGVVLTRSDLC